MSSRSVDGFDPLPYFLAWSEMSLQALLIHDAGLRVLWANAATLRLTAANPAISIRNGQLAWQPQREGARYATFLADLAQGGTWVCGPAGEQALVVRVETLRPPDLAIAFALVVTPVVGDTEAGAWADLGEAFGLTPTEARVAQLAVNGYGIDQIGAALSISLGTARTHLKRVYAKTGVGSRAQLVATLGRYRAS